MLRRAASYMVLVAMVLTLGCAGGNPQTDGIVPASGTITLAGAPLEGASITFYSNDASGRGGSAFSRAGGKFAICTFGDGDGTLPGDYTVVVSKVEVVYPISDEEMLRRESSGEQIPAGKETYFVPTKYGSKDTTDIRVTVPPKGSKKLVIELQDGDKTPPKN